MENRLNALWVGKKLGFLERLSILTALHQGHAFTLYSYTPDLVSNVPSGTELRDAREIIPDDWIMRYFASGFQALGSDFFRYALLAKGLGYWVDLDLIFLKKLDFSQPYVFGWEKQNSINGAVLLLPPDCLMLQELTEVPQLNWKPPFYGPRRTAKFYIKRLIKGNVNPEDHDWGTYGPALITHIAKKTGLTKYAQPSSVFYPLPYFKANLIFEPAYNVEQLISATTRTVHLWHSRLSPERLQAPPLGSYLRTIAEQNSL
jgi:Alpha 1,4-glycosyltransferase conserved region